MFFPDVLKHIARKLLCAFQDRPLLPPSDREIELISQLKAAFIDIPERQTENVVPSEAKWGSYMNRLRDLVLTQDPRKFLRWDVVCQTMFITYAHYIYRELKHLRSRGDWRTRLRDAIVEVSVGHPVPYVFCPNTSANLVHHAYHVSQFEEKTGVTVSDIDFIFEFGGGYGSMCRLFHNLGFTGRYAILDLKPFSALQTYYLTSLGLPVMSLNDFKAAKTGIICVSDVEMLKGVLPGSSGTNKAMFAATWSISETPRHVRDEVLPNISNFDAFLIAYQHRFEEMDNTDFFDRWKMSIDNVDWQTWSITHIPGNSYLVGKSSKID
jgi:hypothetical protein